MTPFASRIQVSIETNVPTCGVYPGFGPMMSSPAGSLAAAAGSGCSISPPRPQRPALKRAECFRKLLLSWETRLLDVSSLITFDDLGWNSKADGPGRIEANCTKYSRSPSGGNNEQNGPGDRPMGSWFAS